MSWGETVSRRFLKFPPTTEGNSVPHAASQVSRTLLPPAIHAEKRASTWAFSCKPVAHGGKPEVFTPSGEPQATVSTAPPEAAVRRVYRQAVLESVIRPRLRTERGQDTMTRRWYQIPGGIPDEDQAALLTAELIVDDDAAAEVATWADSHLSKRPGRSMPLPAPEPASRWQGQHLWVAGALADPEVATHPRLQRVGRQHRRFILQAIASYADHDSGCNVTAANRTIGKKAASLCAEHIARGGTWSGRRTHTLSTTTLAGLVSATTTALADAGWLKERARGRHLTRLERAAAWLRLHLHQTRAASTRDLTVPDHARKTISTPSAPNWACPGNPHLQKLTLRSLWKTLDGLNRIPVLHTYLNFVQLPCLLTVLVGELTRTKAREAPTSNKKPNTLPPPRPTLTGQKLAATLRLHIPWLLRGSTPGKKRHSWALARLLDDIGVTHLTAKQVVDNIDEQLADRHWEIHPDTITHPLAWLRVTLRDLIDEMHNRKT